MRITVKYGQRWFGNSYDTPDYKLSVQSQKPRFGVSTVKLDYQFIRWATGRGAGDKAGYVSGAQMVLSSEEARQLAINLLWAIEQKEEITLPLLFGRAGEAA